MPSISTLVDLVRIMVVSSGTGSFQPGGAVPGFRGIEALVPGSTYSYSIQNGSQFEVGTIYYDGGSGVFVRTPEVSSNGGAAVAFPANVELVFTARAEDLVATGGAFPIVNALGSDPAVAIGQQAASAAIAGKYDASNPSSYVNAAGALAAAVGVASTQAPARSTLILPSGSTLLGFQQSGTGPLTTATVQDKNRQILSAADFAGFDATGVSASTTAIQNALNEAAARGRCDVMIPKGAKTGALTIPGGAGLIGPTTRATLVFDTGSYISMSITGSDTAIRNLETTETAKSGGKTVTIVCGTTLKERIVVENIISWDSYGFLADSGSSGGIHVTTLFRDIQARRIRGHGVEMTRLFAFNWFERFTADYVNTLNGDYTGFKFDLSGLGVAAGGMNMIDCHVLGTLGTTTYSNQRGYEIANTSDVWMQNCTADTVCDDGFRFSSVNKLRGDGLAAGLDGGHGIVLTSVTNSFLVRPEISGRNYLSSPPANKDGLRLVSGCSFVQIVDMLARDMTGYGINKVAAQAGAIFVNGLQATANTLRAVKSVGNTAFLINGGTFGANAAGEYDMAGIYDYIRNVQGNAGGILNVGPGPVVG